MSIDVASIVERARLAAGQPAAGAAGGDERARLARLAQEFESMLLVQMLRSMRTSGSWEDGNNQDTLGAESMFETLDVELASHLARTQGIGLGRELMAAFDRLDPAEASTPVAEDVGQGSPSPERVRNVVTSEFGWRSDPFTGEATFHRGVDLRAAYGQDVQATASGRVVVSGDQGGYGTTVVIEHGDGTRTRYAHLSVALVQEGATVAAGQVIGQAGRSGRATGTHLHFEVIDADGTPLDPRRAANLGL